MYFENQVSTLSVDLGKKVSEIEVSLIVSDSGGQVNITDVFLQGGSIGTTWTAHPSEIKWSLEG